MGRAKRLGVIFATMFKIGLFTFGGGWSIIAQIQSEFVDRRGWMSEEQIADFMSLARSFPGIMIINMSVFCGCAMEGAAGAVAAAIGLSLPALLAIGLVTYFYSSLRNNVIAARMLTGVRSVVIPIMISASLKLKKTAIQSGISWILLLISFVICVFTNVNKLLIVIAGLAAGLLIWRGEVPDDLS